ncbi:MAG: hypothetical protein ACRC41_02480 [Sarcina sp.]
MTYLKILYIGDIKFKRIDIAIDSDLEFVDDFTLIYFIYKLLTTGSGVNSRWSTTSLDILRPNMRNNKSSSFQMEFYDKDLESSG